MNDKKNRYTEKNENKKFEWADSHFLLSALGAVVVMIITQVTQAYTNDWSISQKIFFSIFIGVVYLLTVAIITTVLTICNARSKGKDIVQASENIESAIKDVVKISNNVETALEDIKSIKPVFQLLDNSVKDFSQYTGELVKSNELFQYILDGKMVVDLESSVGCYDSAYDRELEIYIQSSEFTLEESGDLFEAIMWNLRKGIRYFYMIPNDKVEKYKKMLRRWFAAYSSICVSKEKYEEFERKYYSGDKKQYTAYWSGEYKKIINDAKKLWEKEKPTREEIRQLRKRCESLFEELIYTYSEEPCLFFVTIALYEVKETKWEAIVKLPTRDINEEYYAFKIPGGHAGLSKKNFVETFKSYYKNERKYKIDFENDIFKWRD